MTIKQGVRLAETGLLDEPDLRIARALSLDTVDEFADFVSFFPEQASTLFQRLDLHDVGFRAADMSTSSVASIDAVELERLEADQGFGALPPLMELAQDPAQLALGELDASARDSDDEPKVRLSCLGPVRNQGKRGTCVAHTVCAILECVLGDGVAPDLSEQFLYWLCKMNDGAPQASGTWQRVAVPLAIQYGICDEAHWPYNVAQTASESQGPPPQDITARAAAHRATSGKLLDPRWIEAICGELDQQRPVGISVPVYPNWRIAQLSGDIPMPLPGVPPSGGHAMCAVGYGFDDGYLGGGYLIMRNSWGTGWGSQSPFGAGHGTLPFAYVRQFGWEAFTIHSPQR